MIVITARLRQGGDLRKLFSSGFILDGKLEMYMYRMKLSGYGNGTLPKMETWANPSLLGAKNVYVSEWSVRLTL